ncbi:MAG: hypothetical protein DMD96_07470 [Candidatus Rokuibacteriota bacterium]|nr:MAG: hypothetical protein DMD96_07470 [Candidatus Rokubacteria bacterium]
MATVLHLLKSPDTAVARAVLDQHVRAGDRVTVALLPGGVALDLPPSVEVRRLDADLSYAQLLDLIFESDHVVTW